MAMGEPDEDRRRQVAAVIMEDPLSAGIVGGGHESSRLFLEAGGCYIHGFFAAALLCAHGSCERELAGRVAAIAAPPAGWQKWGLGALIKEAVSRGWYSAATIELLKATNEKRRDFFHFRGLWDDGTIATRTLAQRPWGHKSEADEFMSSVLAEDAFEAIKAAFAIRRDR